MKAKLIAEFLGSTFLVMIVLGSGIMGQNLFPGSVDLALLANSIATGAGLFVLIQCLVSISGAHFNPVVSLVEVRWGRLKKGEALLYIVSQMTGAYVGILITHLMFNLSVFQISQVERSGIHLCISEVIATFGLICVIALAGRKQVEFAPASIAAYITSAYWFTSSTSFVNPAVTFARMFSDTFGGMAPTHFLSFISSQILGAILGWIVIRSLKN